MRLKHLVLGMGLLATFASTASAQVQTTGQAVPGVSTTDPNWQVRWEQIGGPCTGNCVTNGGLGVFSSYHAAFVPSDLPTYPAGPWQPDNGTASGPNWISAWGGNTPGGTPQGGTNTAGFAQTQGQHNYDYQFVQTTNVLAGFYKFSIGWDNYITGIYLGNGTTWNLIDGPGTFTPNASGTPSTYGGCDNTGENSVIGAPPCLYSLTTQITATQLSTLGSEIMFETIGDGTTDAFYLNSVYSATPFATVPEPATMSLLGLGLVGMTGASFRRRRRQS